MPKSQDKTLLARSLRGHRATNPEEALAPIPGEPASAFEGAPKPEELPEYAETDSWLVDLTAQALRAPYLTERAIEAGAPSPIVGAAAFADIASTPARLATTTVLGMSAIGTPSAGVAAAEAGLPTPVVGAATGIDTAVGHQRYLAGVLSSAMLEGKGSARVGEMMQQHSGYPVEMHGDAIDAYSFHASAEQWYYDDLQDKTGKRFQDMTPEEQSKAARGAAAYADHEIARGLHYGGIFVTAEPSESDWAQSLLKRLNPTARAVIEEPLKAVMAMPVPVTGMGMLSHAAGNPLVAGVLSAATPPGMLAAATLPLADLSAAFGYDIREDPEWNQRIKDLYGFAFTDVKPNAHIPAPMIDDPLGYAALTFDTAAVAMTPYGRRVLGGNLQYARPQATGGDILWRSLIMVPTTMASMMAFNRTGGDPREFAAYDLTMMENNYAAGKELGENLFGEGSWVASLLGYVAGATGLGTDLAIPGGPIEGGLLTAASLVKAYRASRFALTPRMLRSAIRVLEPLLDAEELKHAIRSDINPKLGPGVEQIIRTRLAAAAKGEGAEDLLIAEQDAFEEFTRARVFFEEVEEAFNKGKATTKEYKDAEKLLERTKQIYGESRAPNQVLKTMGIRGDQLSQGDRYWVALGNLLDGHLRVSNMPFDDVVKALRKAKGEKVPVVRALDEARSTLKTVRAGVATDAVWLERVARKSAGAARRLVRMRLGNLAKAQTGLTTKLSANGPAAFGTQLPKRALEAEVRLSAFEAMMNGTSTVAKDVKWVSPRVRGWIYDLRKARKALEKAPKGKRAGIRADVARLERNLLNEGFRRRTLAAKHSGRSWAAVNPKAAVAARLHLDALDAVLAGSRDPKDMAALTDQTRRWVQELDEGSTMVRAFEELRIAAKNPLTRRRAATARQHPALSLKTNRGQTTVRVGDLVQRWDTLLRTMDNDLVKAESGVQTAVSGIESVRAEVAANISGRIYGVVASLRGFVDELRMMEESYLVAGGRFRDPPDVLLDDIARTVPGIRDPGHAKDVLLTMENIIRMAFDPAAHSLGVQGFRQYALRMVDFTRRMFDPNIYEGGALNPVVTKAWRAGEAWLRARHHETLEVAATAGRDRPLIIARLDQLMGSTDPVEYGGRVTVMVGQALEKLGLEGAGARARGAATARTVTNRVVEGVSPSGQAQVGSWWDQVINKFWGTRLPTDFEQKVAHAVAGSKAEVKAPWKEPGLLEYANSNPDLRGHAFMWVGADALDEIQEFKLLGHALTLLAEGKKGPKGTRVPYTHTEFRAAMRDFHLIPADQGGITLYGQDGRIISHAPDSQEEMVVYRQALASSWSASVMRSREIIETALGGMLSEGLAKDINAMLKMDFSAVRDQRAAETLAHRMGISLYKTGTASAADPAGDFMQAVGGVWKGELVGPQAAGKQPFWVPHQISKRWESFGDEFVKSTERYTPKGFEPGNSILRSAFMSAWKRSVVTGTIFPDAGYLWQNIIGDWAQMAMEIGMVRSTQLSFSNLVTNVPVVNRYLAKLRHDAFVKAGGRVTLPHPVEVLLNPKLASFMRGEGGLVFLKNGMKFDLDLARRAWIEQGGMATFPQTEILADLVRARDTDLVGKATTVGKKLLYPVKQWSDSIATHADVVQRWQRAGLFLDEAIRNGGDYSRAGKVMRDALYDYVTFVSDVERRGIARPIPFYSYWKNNLRQQTMAFKQFFDDPTLETAFLRGRMQNVKRMHQLGRMLMAAGTEDDDPELESWKKTRSPWLSDWMNTRITMGIAKLPQWKQEFFRQYLGIEADATVVALPPMPHDDGMEVMMAPIIMMLGLAQRADATFFGGDNLDYEMAPGWEQHAIEPITGLLGPGAYPGVVGLMEGGGWDTGAFGVREYTRTHPVIQWLEAQGMPRVFTTSDYDEETGQYRPRMSWFASYAMNNFPVLNEALLFGKNGLLQNVKLPALIRAVEARERGEEAPVFKTAMEYIWAALVGGLGRTAPRLTDTMRNQEYAQQDIKRYMDARRKWHEGQSAQMRPAGTPFMRGEEDED